MGQRRGFGFTVAVQCLFFFLISPSPGPQSNPTNLQGSHDFHQMLCFS